MPDGVAAAGTSCDSCAEGQVFFATSTNPDQQAHQPYVTRSPVDVAVVALSALPDLVRNHQPVSVMTIEPGVTCPCSVLPGCLGSTVISQCLQPNGSVLLLLLKLSRSSCTDHSEARSTWRVFASLISSPACWRGAGWSDDQMLQRTESLAMLPEHRQQPRWRLSGCQQTVRSKPIPLMGCRDLLPDDFSPDLPASPGAALCSQVPVQVGPASVARRLHLLRAPAAA